MSFLERLDIFLDKTIKLLDKIDPLFNIILVILIVLSIYEDNFLEAVFWLLLYKLK